MAKLGADAPESSPASPLTFADVPPKLGGELNGHAIEGGFA